MFMAVSITRGLTNPSVDCGEERGGEWGRCLRACDEGDGGGCSCEGGGAIRFLRYFRISDVPR